MSRNYKPRRFSRLSLEVKEQRMLEEEKKKEQMHKEELERQKQDAETLIALAQAVKGLQTALNTVEMKSRKGKGALLYLLERLEKAHANCNVLATKLKEDK